MIWDSAMLDPLTIVVYARDPHRLICNSVGATCTDAGVTSCFWDLPCSLLARSLLSAAPTVSVLASAVSSWPQPASPATLLKPASQNSECGRRKWCRSGSGALEKLQVVILHSTQPSALCTVWTHLNWYLFRTLNLNDQILSVLWQFEAQIINF